MTPEHERRPRSKRAPFDGSTVAAFDDLDLATLRTFLILSADRLESSFQHIMVYPDWHEHDGYITDPGRTTWSEVRSLLRDDRSLFKGRDPDDLVKIAWFPDSYEWLLRFNIDADDGNDITAANCAFDFSSPATSAAAPLLEGLTARWPGSLGAVSPDEFFKDR